MRTTLTEYPPRRMCIPVLVFALALVALALYPVSATTGENAAWTSFCSKEKNYSLCNQGDHHCEVSAREGLTCDDIRDVIMRYRGFSIAHLKAARKQDRQNQRRE